MIGATRSHTQRFTTAVLALVAILAGGCAGGDETYSAEPTMRCLNQSGEVLSALVTREQRVHDAQGKRLFIAFPDENRMDIFFAARSEQAESVVAWAATTDTDPFGQSAVERDHNAVLAWFKRPPQGQRDLVDDYLR